MVCFGVGLSLRDCVPIRMGLGHLDCDPTPVDERTILQHNRINNYLETFKNGWLLNLKQDKTMNKKKILLENHD